MSTKKPGFRLPPKNATSAPSDEELRKKAEEFIRGADTTTADATGKAESDRSTPPWETLNDDRKDRYKPFLMRFTHKEKGMLEFIENHSPDSQHGFIISILRPAIEAEALRLWKERK